MFCGKCNKENTDDATICVHCGSDLTEQSPPGDLMNTLDGGRTIPAPDDPTDDVPEDANRSMGSMMATINKAAHAPQFEPTGTIIGGRYEIIERIGDGGMGVVYRAKDGQLPREVAVKRLRATQRQSRRGVQRFFQEARSIATLNHRHIVTIYEVGEDERGPFIVMELLPGGDLQQKLRTDGKFDLKKAMELTKNIGQALAFAHKRKIIHRDVKPSNILFAEDGTAKLVDFGLAQMGGGSDISVTGAGMGTMAYMPPEQQIDAKRADHRSDIYSLAKTLYHLVTGEMPLTVDMEQTPLAIRGAMRHALKTRPEDRPFSIEEFLEELAKPSEQQTRISSDSLAPGQCASCGHANPTEARHCEECGAGLFELCPKCGKEKRVSAKRCGACGVDVAAHATAKKALAAARSQLKAKHYGRTIKEANRGLETGELKTDLDAVLSEATKAKERLGLIIEQIPDKLAEGNWQVVMEMIKEGIGLAADPKKQFPSWHIEAQLQRARKALADKNFAETKNACEQVLGLEEANAEAISLKKRADQMAAKYAAEAAVLKADILFGQERFAEAAIAYGAILDYPAFAAVTREKMNRSRRLANLLGVARNTRGLKKSLKAWKAVSAAAAGDRCSIATEEIARLEKKILQRPMKIKLIASAVATAAITITVVSLIGFSVVSERERQTRIQVAAEAQAQVQAEAQAKAQAKAKAKAKAQENAAMRLGISKEMSFDLGTGVTMQFVLIPAGEFRMGSPASEAKRGSDEGPVHTVKLSKSFYMGVTEVTQAQYQVVMGKNPSGFKGAKNPVECVSWNDATSFCKKLSAKTGKAIRLPTEAEWEYACRAGTTTPFHFGNTISTDQANYNGYYTYGNGRKGVYRQKTVPVGSFQPNGWGLYDMHGNAWEWCQDWYGKYSSGTVTDPTGPSSGSSRVVRGGSWFGDPWYCRSASRDGYAPVGSDDDVGFRVVVVASSSALD